MKKILLIILTISLTIFPLSCAKYTENSPAETINPIEVNEPPKTSIELPEGFTVENIKNAFLEYSNYFLWYSPLMVDGTPKFVADIEPEEHPELSDNFLFGYIGEYINVEIRLYDDNDTEIRLYDDNSVDSVYASISAGEWLVVFREKDGFVYSPGHLHKSSQLWPEGNYEIVEKYSVKIPEPHTPNFGTSKRKDMMVDAAVSTVKERLGESSNGHKSEKVHIENFFEYEGVTTALIFLNNDSVLHCPINFDEDENGITAQIGKVNTMEKEHLGITSYRRIEDAIVSFEYNVNK